ncbi:MAG: orotate phosphoribosyltransferase [Thermoanaerobaculia bacterium]
MLFSVAGMNDSFDLAALLESTGALLTGHFRLSSGLHSPNYVQCAKLLEHPRNAAAIGRALAAMIAPLKPEKIVAPAMGGVVIGYAVAEALDLPMIFTERKDGVMSLRRGFSVTGGERLVVVEDVVTTGKSTRETVEVVESLGGEVIGFASILNRSGRENPFDRPYVTLMALGLETHPPDACPHCRRGEALDAPGSRFTNR